MTTKSAQTRTAARMAEACTAFLDSLSPQQRDKATYLYEDGERVFWSYFPLNRHGLALRDMGPEQRKLAYGVMAAGLADRAYRQAEQIIDHETVLRRLEEEAGTLAWVRDPDLYYFTVFGDPEGDDPWGWRAEGHHLSLNYSIWRHEVISATPLFFGANPAEVRSGPKKGLRILADTEDLAFELMESMDAGQLRKTVIYDKAPKDILTYSAIRASLADEEGLPGSQMSGTQREMLMTLMTEYVLRAPTVLSERELARLEENGLDGVHIAWGGPVKKGEGHYYRIHSGNFFVEFDNQQNDANHIHSVWRDVANDFANDVLREHLLIYHVL